MITFFQNALIYRWGDLESWNQLQMASNISKFHVHKKAFKNIQPSFLIWGLKCWPQKGSWNIKFCRVIRPYPLARPWYITSQRTHNQGTIRFWCLVSDGESDFICHWQKTRNFEYFSSLILFYLILLASQTADCL